ncbi:hypothetical protein LL967_20475, partial [Xanthomonas campestris pv. zinniae]|nr:hypothetical protein [Xanthomonas campestris pv. zinniae]
SDPGSYGSPRRLSTPTLPHSEQIRLDGGIHAANGPAIGEDTTPDSWLVVLLKSKHTPRRQLASRC